MGIFNKLFKKKETVRQREGNPDVHDLSNNDTRMNWGMEKAKLTLHYFETCLKTPKEGQVYFSIKARVEDEGKIEHIWLLDPNFDDQGNIFGTIGNEPIDVSNVQIHQKIGISKDNVSDWMIIEQGRLIGGYTIRAIRDNLSGDALQQFDQNLGGMIVDEGEDYFLPNFETPEGAILKLEEAYDHDNLEDAINCKDFHQEATFMLKERVKFELETKLIDSTAEALRLAFIQSLQENGMPKFAGMKRAFKRQKISSEHYVITEICYYPDGGMSSQKLHTYKIEGHWKVLGLAN